MINLNAPVVQDLFAALIKLFDCRVIVEIGVATGSTTPTLCRATIGTVYGYDVWAQHGQQGQFGAMGSMVEVESILTAQGLTNFQLHQVNTATEECSALLPENIDFVFIDGDHSYAGALNDFLKVLPKLASRCIIVFHDTLQIDGSRALMLELESKYTEFQFVNLPQIHVGTDYGMTLLVRNLGGHPIGEICGSPIPNEDIYAQECKRFGSQR